MAVDENEAVVDYAFTKTSTSNWSILSCKSERKDSPLIVEKNFSPKLSLTRRCIHILIMLMDSSSQKFKKIAPLLRIPSGAKEKETLARAEAEERRYYSRRFC